MRDPADFTGAKLILFLGEDLLVLRRDHMPGIAWPGRLDFPGGGREGGESAEQCALRETQEEVGLRFAAEEIVWRKVWQGAAGRSWFFVIHADAARAGDVRFGGEGAGWLLMRPALYLASPDAIPHFRDVLGIYLEG